MTALVRGAMKTWERFWFEPVPAVRIGLLRILLFGFSIVDVLIITTPQGTELGRIPGAFWRPVGPIWLLSRIGVAQPSGVAISVVEIVLVMTSLLAALGYRFRITGPAAALFYLYWQGVQLSYGGVDHSRYSFVPALLVLAVAPAATARSFDSLRARMRVARDDMRVPDATAAAAADAAVVSGWPMRFIQLNVVFLYVFSGFSKLKASGLKWTTSNTLGQAFQSKGTLIGHAMNRRPIVVALQVFTESWELSMALAFWRRTRWIVLGLGVMWQLGVLATLNIEFFGVMMTYFAFVPLERVEAWAVARLRQRAGADGRPRVVVYFDGHCPLCIRTVTFLRAADWTDRMTLVDFRREGVPEGATVERASRELLASVEHEPLRGGYDALVRLSRELVPLRPLHPVLATGAVSAIGRRAYVFVSERRAILHCPPGAACALT